MLEKIHLYTFHNCYNHIVTTADYGIFSYHPVVSFSAQQSQFLVIFCLIYLNTLWRANTVPLFHVSSVLSHTKRTSWEFTSQQCPLYHCSKRSGRHLPLLADVSLARQIPACFCRDRKNTQLVEETKCWYLTILCTSITCYCNNVTVTISTQHLKTALM